MRRKLLVLDLVLLAMLGWLGWRLRQDWAIARQKERSMIGRKVTPAPPPPVAKVAPAKPVVPAEYSDIAQKMLFSKDRNPVVVVETPAPPPPKPMPPLPLLYGVMNLGLGPTAILSEKKGAANRDYRPGETVGEFRLVSVNEQEIVYEWDGKIVRRKVDEIIERSSPEQQQVAEARPAAAPAAPAPPTPSVPKGPGRDIGIGRKACQPGDSNPAGTVVDGMRKVTRENPFGTECMWEPVR